MTSEARAGPARARSRISVILAQSLVNEISGFEHALHLAQKFSEELSTDRTLGEKIEVAKFICNVLEETSIHVDGSAKREKDKLTQKIVDFLMTAIDLERDPHSKDQLAGLCVSYPPIALSIESALVSSLFTSVEFSISQKDELSLISKISIDEFRSLRHGFKFNVVDSESLNAASCLGFLPVFYQNASLLPETFSILFCSLVMLSGAYSKAVARSATDAALAILTHAGNHPLAPEALRNVHDFIWARLTEYCLYDGDRMYQENAQSILLRVVSVPSLAYPAESLLHSEEYWRFLHQTLRAGSHESRKFCLATVGISMTRLHMDFSNQYHEFRNQDSIAIAADLFKFCTIFHTIVLGRYLNQTQECLPDLLLLSASSSHLHKAWIMTLFFAAIENSMQDSGRRLIGSWILKHGFPILKQLPSSIPLFLEGYLLPWAIEGKYFNANAEIEESDYTISTHGESLSDFIVHLIVSVQAQEHRDESIHAILRFLIKSTPRTYPFPRAYILEGLLKAFKRTRIELKPDMVTAIEKLSGASHFHELANDYMVLLCHELLGFGDVSGSKKFEMIKQTCLALRSCPTTYNDEQGLKSAVEYLGKTAIVKVVDLDKTMAEALQYLEFWIRESKNQCLKGHGMQAACDILRHAFDRCTITHDDVGSLHFVLEALWDEVEIQDYPRRIMMQLPEILLHPSCLQQSLSNSELQTFVLNISQQIQSFSENRVYLLPPFARAFRRAVLHSSLASTQFFIHTIVRYANNPPRTKVESRLLHAISHKLQSYIPWRTYEHYYGDPEGYGHALILDVLNNLPNAYLDHSKEIVDTLLHRWLKQKQPPPVFSPWKKTSQLQVIVILMEHLATHIPLREVDEYLLKVFKILTTEPLPILRYLLEWITVRLCQNLGREKQLLEMLKDADTTNPKYVVSIMKMCLTVAGTPEATEEFGFDLMLLLFIQSSGSKIAIRHEAQWSIPILWDYAKSKSWRNVLENPAFERLNDFIRSMEAYKHPPRERLPEVFNVTDHHNLTHLVEGDYLNIEPSEAPRLHRSDLVKIINDSHVSERTGVDLPSDMSIESPSKPPHSRLPLGQKQKPKIARFDETSKELKPTPSPFSVSIPLQIKSQQYMDLVALGPSAGTLPQKRPVILLASLIDNSYNLGGLSRISEIFGVSSMLVRNIRAVQTKEFQSVSVSSEKHLPITPLAVEDTPSYLGNQKLEGYTVVGVEQTDSSRVLGDATWDFEEKIIFVMGSEKEGIPARVLQECNYCVVIKQKGVTRSMNVQTAAAVCMYEYARQELVGKLN